MDVLDLERAVERLGGRIDEAHPGRRRLLIRRNTTTGEPAFYRCHAPEPMPLLSLVRIAGIRWAVEAVTSVRSSVPTPG